MKTKTISEALFSSIGKRVQSFRKLAETKLNKGKKEWEIKKYCAIGAIGCENKFLKLINNSDSIYGIKYSLSGNDEKSILRNTGISAKTMNKDYRNYMTTEAVQAIAKKTPYSLKDRIPLHRLIMALNDNCKWTYAKIAEEMKQLEERKIITYEVQK